jgi:hypothetical protein
MQAPINQLYKFGHFRPGVSNRVLRRNGRLEMLKGMNRRRPYYWASFIQSGEWADLEGKG